VLLVYDAIFSIVTGLRKLSTISAIEFPNRVLVLRALKHLAGAAVCRNSARCPELKAGGPEAG
jgi:hypothetical protein